MEWTLAMAYHRDRMPTHDHEATPRPLAPEIKNLP